jgi:hypothetical protein
MRDIFGSVVNSGDATQLGAVSENIIPSVTDVIDVGSGNKRFRNGKFKALTVETIECQTFTSYPAGDIVIGTGANTCTIASGDGVHSNAFIKAGGTNSQLLLADGTTANTSAYATVASVTPLTVATQNQVAVSGITTLNGTLAFGGALESRTITGVTNIYGSPGYDLSIGVNVNSISLISSTGVYMNKVLTPTIDTAQATPLSIGATNCTTINVGRSGLIVNISNAYSLPTTAPQLGQVITCDSLGNSSWMTPSPSAYAAIYPFTTASRTGFLAAASKTYCTTYTMGATVTLTMISICLGSTGSDASKIGVYRGDLTTATLVGQTTSGAPTSNYYSRTLTVVAGQNLTFAIGDQISVVYTTSGSTTTPAYRTLTSNIALATISSNTYTGGLPSTIAGILLQTATTTRICLELA